MSRVVHFEIHAGDPQLVIDFYTALFGWKFEPWGESGYWIVTTGEDNPADPWRGINGGLTKRVGPAPAPAPGVSPNAFVNVIAVADAHETFTRGIAAGGSEALPVTESPGVGLIGYLRDPDGNIFGIIQPDTSGMEQGPAT